MYCIVESCSPLMSRLHQLINSYCVSTSSGLHLTVLCVLVLAVKRKKRKMGMYNLVPKKKAKALKQQEKAGPLIDLFLYVSNPEDNQYVTFIQC